MSSSPEVAGVDFFAHGGLPVPPVTILQAERVAASFGLTVRAQPLGSQQDSNFLLADGGRVLGVLKIANPAFSAAEIEAQDAAGTGEVEDTGDGAGRVLFGRWVVGGIVVDCVGIHGISFWGVSSGYGEQP